MASKMENWINYQQRHLAPAAFEAWKAGNVKVQSYLKKREGAPRAIQVLDDLQKDVWKKVMAPAIQEASEQMLEGRFIAAHELAKLCKVETLNPSHLRAVGDRATLEG